MLTSTSYRATESAPPGEGRGGGIGGGAPLRYDYTAPGYCALSSWNDATYTYSILQLNLGSNPISKIEVVSTLNTLNLGRAMYYFYYKYRLPKYNIKVYIGTSQTIAIQWNFDLQNIENYPSIWPEVKPQKGEANIMIFNCFMKKY